MNKELITNLAKQALVAANGIAEICCETDEERDFFWQSLVENAGGPDNPVIPPKAVQLEISMNAFEEVWRRAWKQALEEAKAGWPGNMTVDQAWYAFKREKMAQ